MIFEGIVNVTLSEEVSTTGVTHGNLEFFLDSHQTQKNNMKLVDKTKNLWLIVEPLPIRAG